jgi:hypothetical protein
LSSKIYKIYRNFNIFFASKNHAKLKISKHWDSFGSHCTNGTSHSPFSTRYSGKKKIINDALFGHDDNDTDKMDELAENYVKQMIDFKKVKMRLTAIFMRNIWRKKITKQNY